MQEGYKRQKRRIVLVTNGLALGGAEVQMVRLARSLRGQGDDVRLLSILPARAFADELAELGVRIAHVRLVRPFPALSAVADGARILRRWRPDVVISFVYQANVLARLAGRLARVPVIVCSIRNERFGGRMRELVLRVTDSLCTVTTTNSQLAAQSLIQRGVVPASRLVVVPNGLDPQRYQPRRSAREEMRRALAVGGEFLWLSVGRLEAQKDHATLLQAMAALACTSRRVQLRVAGQGPLRPELEALAARLGVADRVAFLGPRLDVADLYGAADAFVLSSQWEGLPNVLMEAMAAELPVVATRVGGTPELVEHDRTGLLVPPRDPAALAQAMGTISGLDPRQRKAMGERACLDVAARFSQGEVARRWLALVDGCMALAGR